jgi:hypothetical protein
MRKLIPFAFALLVACGSSSSGSSPAPAPPPTTGLTGTVGGHTFTPVAVQALSVGSGSSPCNLPGVGVLGVSAVEIAITSYADACGDLASSQCRRHPSSQAVTVLVAKANPIPPNAAPTLTPGTYNVQSSITTAVPEASGLLDVAYAEAVAPDPSCVGTAHPSKAGGTVRIDQVTGPITGHLSLTFDDGSTLSGDFSAPICPGVNPDVCSRALGGALCTQPPTSVP